MTPPTAAAKPNAAPSIAPASGRMFNFSAGPGVMPDEVLRQIQAEVWDCRNSGVGILEHSHRAPVYDAILAEAEADCRAVGGIPASHRVLFMTGGSTSQNFLVPMNLLPPDKSGTADYFDTGYWAHQSIEHAKPFGKIHVAGSSREQNYTFIPAESQTRFSERPAYVHFTSNNTIYGTQWHRVPSVPAGAALVCDMCSDIFSRPVDYSRFDLVYASAQKNLGPAGATIVIVRDELIQKTGDHVPYMLRYKTFAATESRPNTPPVFPIYAMGLMFKWIRAQGGVGFFEKHNAAKAKIVYDVLDASTFYKGHAEKGSRSLMNVTFRTPSEALDKQFCAEAGKQGLVYLAGHRATGGMRASLYNAMPTAGAQALAQFMREFERRNG